MRWQFAPSTHSPSLMTAVVSTLKRSGWRHVESDTKKGGGGGGGEGELHTRISVS